MTHAGSKVLIISAVFPPARIAEGDHVLHICRKLAERGFEIEVLTSQGAIEAMGWPFRVRPVMLKWNWYELPLVTRVAKQFAPDVVFLWFVGHAYNFHPMIVFVPTVFKSLLPKVRIITQITSPIWSCPERHSLVTRLTVTSLSMLIPSVVDYRYGTLFSHSDRVIAMSESHQEEFARRSRRMAVHVASKCAVIPPPPFIPMSSDTGETRISGRQALGLADGDFVFAFFGRLYRGKGIETLIEAFKRLRNRYSNIRLAVIGGADSTESAFGDVWQAEVLGKLIRTVGPEDGVVWTGEYPWDSELGSIYLRAADAVVLPFDKGVQLNNSSFAAVAAHGIPTITTRGTVLKGPFLDGENVLLCSPLDPVAMASTMERLLLDSELRRRLHSGIESLAREWFSWEVTIDKTVAALDSDRSAVKREISKRSHQPTMPGCL